MKIKNVKDLVELRHKQDVKDIKRYKKIVKELEKHDYGKDLRLFQRVFKELGALVSENRFYVRCKHKFGEVIETHFKPCQKCPAHRIRLPDPFHQECVFTDRRWNKLRKGFEEVK